MYCDLVRTRKSSGRTDDSDLQLLDNSQTLSTWVEFTERRKRHRLEPIRSGLTGTPSSAIRFRGNGSDSAEIAEVSLSKCREEGVLVTPHMATSPGRLLVIGPWCQFEGLDLRTTFGPESTSLESPRSPGFPPAGDMLGLPLRNVFAGRCRSRLSLI